MAPRIAQALREREHTPSELRALLAREPLEALALALALRAPSEPILRWVTDLRGVGLEISGDDLLAAGVPEGPAVGRALEETLRRKLDGLVSGREEELETALQLARGARAVRLPGATVTFTTRQGGVSEGPYESLNLGILTDDEPDRVRENRADRGRAGGHRRRADRDGLAGARRGHPRLDRAAARSRLRGPGRRATCEKLDGHITRDPGVGLLVLVADCFPVALSDGEQVAMLHCGWRPLAGGHPREGARALRGAPAGRGRARASAAAATRWARRCWRRSRTCDGAADGPHARPPHGDRGAAGGRGRDGRPARRPLHQLRARPLLLPPPRQRRDRPPGGHHRARWILSASGATSSAVRERIGAEVEVLAAVKYVPERDLPALAEAGIELVGENRAQDLLAKQEAHGDLFTWDFIGQLQSRKVKDIAPHVRLIHSVASESALRKLEEHPAKEVLIQVNVAGEEGKAGHRARGARRLHRPLPGAR